MADKDAKVRLNLAAAGFQSGLADLRKKSKELEDALDGVGDGAKRASSKAGALKSVLLGGLGAGKNALGDMASQLKSTIGMAASLGGALSIGGAVSQTMDLASQYRDIAFAIQAGTGQATEYTQVQSMVEASAKRWSRANGEVADSFKAVYDDVGSIEYAKAAMDEVSKAARATGAPIESLRTLAGQLNEKFGITSKELPDAMAAMIAMGNKGGLSVADLSDKMGIFGASAKMAGLQGKEGLTQVVAMLNLADGATGNLKKAVGSVGGLLDQLGSPEAVKKMERALDPTGENPVSLRNKDGSTRTDAIDRILKKTGGNKDALSKALTGSVTGDSLKLLVSMGETYAKAFSETEGKVKVKTQAGLDAYHQALLEAGKQTLTAAQLEAQAQERLKDPRAQMQAAINKFTESFNRPEVAEAVSSLADSMPKLASVLGDVVGFAVDHPIATGLGVIGGRTAMAATTNMASSVAVSFAKGQASSIGAEIAASAAKNGAWGAAGMTLAKVAGPLVAAAVAYELGKAAIDSYFDSKDQATGDVIAAGADTQNIIHSGNKGKMEAQADRLRKTIAKSKEAEGGVGGYLGQAFGGVALMTGAITQKEFDASQNATAKAEAELRSLEEALSKGADGGNKASQAFDRLAAAADKVASKMNAVNGGAGTNGLPKAPGNAPGAGRGPGG